MVGVVGSNPIVPTNSEKGRACDPFFMPCLSVRQLSESIRAPYVSSDFDPPRSA